MFGASRYDHRHAERLSEHRYGIRARSIFSGTIDRRTAKNFNHSTTTAPPTSTCRTFFDAPDAWTNDQRGGGGEGAI